MKHWSAYSIAGIIASAAMVIGCANPGTPTGGPKDRKPPVLVKSTPSPNSTGFSGSSVVLTFDENIQLKDQDKKFVMSPPVMTKTKLDAHGNVLRVTFEGDTCLMPGTTYTLDFADCVSDLNESNVLENFTFTFSTGESQDSMMISGNVYDAKNITPVNGIYVLLHSNLSDTAFTTTSPVRIAKTDNTGRFAIKNVPADRKYRIYALDDMNKDYKYNKGMEVLGWHKDEITPGWEIRHINDSVRIDTLGLKADTADWVFEKVVRDTLVYTPDSLILFTFKEEKYEQYITSDQRKERNQMRMIFNRPMKEKPRVSFPGQENADNKDNCHATVEYSITNDTVSIWMTDTLIYKKDSIVVALTYPVLDSLMQMVDKTDTLTMWHKEKVATKEKGKGRRKKGDDKPKVEKVTPLKLTVASSTAVYCPISITSGTPYKEFDWSKVTLSHKVDTNYVKMKYAIVDDTVDLKRKAIKAEWEPGVEYEISIDSAAVTDIYGLVCNKGSFKFGITPLDKYGTLYIIVDGAGENSLLQLMDNKDNVMRQNYVPKNGRLAFRYLKPMTYMIRIVDDANRNGKLDLGDFDKKELPEELTYYMESVAVRANWDIKVEFDVKKYSPDKYAKKFKIKGGDKKKNNNR